MQRRPRTSNVSTEVAKWRGQSTLLVLIVLIALEADPGLLLESAARDDDGRVASRLVVDSESTSGRIWHCGIVTQ